MPINYVLDGAHLEPGQQVYAGLRGVAGEMFELTVAPLATESLGPDRPIGPAAIVGHGDPAPGGGIRVTFEAPHTTGRYAFAWIVDGQPITDGMGNFEVLAAAAPAPRSSLGARVLPGRGARIVR